MGLRRNTVRELKAQAADTMTSAQATLVKARSSLSVADQTMLEIKGLIGQAVFAICQAIEEVMDGSTFDATLMGKKLPLEIQWRPRESEEEKGQ